MSVEVAAADKPDRFEEALRRVAAGAAERDAATDGAFPSEAIDALRGAGVLAANAVAGTSRPPAAGELSLVRRVAAADGAVGRILDGHLNGVERIAVQAPAAVRDSELARVRAGDRLLGVWGGQPIPGEGPPLRVVTGHGGDVLRGVLTFCSGAGGVQSALVLARDGDDPRPWLVLCDVGCDRVEVDRSWYRSRGLAASASHRVVFHDAPVIARVGGPGAVIEQPWFGRDGLRTAASWAGMVDSAFAGALDELRARPTTGELEGLAVGRMTAERGTIDAWLASAARAMDGDGSDLAATSLNARVGIAAAARRLLDEAARACGSHPFATAGRLDRARRDLEVFLLQHRLDPALARAGSAALAADATT